MRKGVETPRRPRSKGRGILQDSTCLHAGEGCLALGSSRGKRRKECRGVTGLPKPPGITITWATIAGGYSWHCCPGRWPANSSKVCVQLSSEPGADWRGSWEHGFVQAGKPPDSQHPAARPLCVFRGFSGPNTFLGSSGVSPSLL